MPFLGFARRRIDWLRLPDEILLEILLRLQLDPPGYPGGRESSGQPDGRPAGLADLCAVQRTCRVWSALARSEDLWRQLYLRDKPELCSAAAPSCTPQAPRSRLMNSTSILGGLVTVARKL